MTTDHAINLPLDIVLMTLLFGVFLGATWLVERFTERETDE